MSRFLKISMVLLTSTILAESVTITQEEFNSATTKNGFRTPPREYYNYFVEGASKYSKEDQAMLLAQLLHESQGFYYTEEQACLLANNKCDRGYYVNKDVDLPGKKYHGRGFIQLTGSPNYKAASQALGLGDKLLREPEIVASDKRLAMLVSIWFWDANVRPQLNKKGSQFGVTTFVINSGQCKYPQYHSVAQKRWKIYLNVADAFGIISKAKETGCYN